MQGIYIFKHQNLMFQTLPDIEASQLPDRFNNPFRYAPHPAVRKAAEAVMEEIENDSFLSAALKEGKMLGVLIVRDEKGTIGFIRGFSGNAGGKSIIEGFVPPIYDLTCPEGHFRMVEAEISRITSTIKEIEAGELEPACRRLEEARLLHDNEEAAYRKEMAESKLRRDKIRRAWDPEGKMLPLTEEELERESQFQKAQLNRMKRRRKYHLDELEGECTSIRERILGLRDKRARMSDELQKWIFSRYIVHNMKGEEASVADIFSAKGLVPPGGTGECAAPKLLEYAYRHHMTPLAMGEFWYGKSPETAVRTHGHFYPSCTSKCGPLLEFMLKGADMVREDTSSAPGGIVTVFEDEYIIAVSKPSGMPSVPGLDGRTSLMENLSATGRNVESVHRLDMDTSGIILYAKTAQATFYLRRQFEMHTVGKTYLALLSPSLEGRHLVPGEEGTIYIPLSPDHDERPRQKADTAQGKPAKTAYKVLSTDPDGCIHIRLFPETGRTHQLRVHCAHRRGLGHPIVGDMLYGGTEAPRLHLHAESITFRHPVTGEPMTLKTSDNSFQNIDRQPSSIP